MTTLLTAALWYTISDSPGNDDTEISLQASVPPADAAAPVTGNRQYIVEFAPTFEGGGIHMCAWQWHFLLLPTPSSSLANTNTCVIYNVICSHFVTLYNLYVVSLTQQVVKEIDKETFLWLCVFLWLGVPTRRTVEATLSLQRTWMGVQQNRIAIAFVSVFQELGLQNNVADSPILRNLLGQRFGGAWCIYLSLLIHSPP